MTNAHGRVGVKRKPLSPGQAKRRARRIAERNVTLVQRVEHREYQRGRWERARQRRREQREAEHKLFQEITAKGLAAIQPQMDTELPANQLPPIHPSDYEALTGLPIPIPVEEDASGDLVETLSAAQAAELLGKSETWVKAHAVELGGTKHRLRWQFN